MAAAVAVCHIAGAAQQVQTFRAGVDLVRVEASVVDDKGRPVKGLTSADFAVREDGKTRPIVAFEAVDIPLVTRRGPDEPVWVRDAPLDVFTNAVSDDRLFMIVIDDITMPGDGVILGEAKRIAADVVRQLGDGDQAAVAFTRAEGAGHPFTSDRSQLLAAIARTGTGLLDWKQLQTPCQEIPDEAQLVNVVRTLEDAVNLVQAAPQLRKTLVFISVGTPVNLERLEPKRLKPCAARVVDKGPSPLRDYRWLMAELLKTAERARVKVYAFDPSGLGGLEDWLAIPIRRVEGFEKYAWLSEGSLKDLAAATGGRATTGKTDPNDGIDQMFADASTFYILGFESATNRAGRRSVDIRTTRPGLKVVGQRAVWIPSAEEKVAAMVASPLGDAIASLLPDNDLPLRATATVLPAAEGGGAIVALAVGVNQPTERLVGVEQLRAEVYAYDMGGKRVAATRLETSLTFKASEAEHAQYELLATLPIARPGRYQVRVAAHIERLNRRGSVFADVDVPEFDDRRVTVVPLVVTSSPASPSAPQDAFTGLLPVVPTSHRSFGATERVSILARVVQGGQSPLAPIAVEVAVDDARGRRVFNQTESLVPRAGAAGRTMDYVFDLPIAALAVGDYILTVNAKLPDEKVSVRTLRFGRR